MSILPITPIADALPILSPVQPAPPIAPAPNGGFASLLTNGIDGVDAKLRAADDLTRRFALDDSIPVHQVSFSLEQARMSLELMLQVRNRLVEGYQQLMNMQL
ncbi:flagellar hook-basal body complex protein FliE [Flavisphingomonas formosensis]|uniref:flagellar hook-basal body complex protein FliE n=1 Tax=Flavisphingomonas formosensis TaxID=861534 RepID=UPI0012F80594|nr:flagellar hook-basal body complex protein FliE [Sphingomonas formosensis]